MAYRARSRPISRALGHALVGLVGALTLVTAPAAMAQLPQASGYVTLGNATVFSQENWQIYQAGVSNSQGNSAVGVGDVNGDGFDDVATCAPEADPGGRTDAGSCYVIFGSGTDGRQQLFDLPATGPIGSRGIRIDGQYASGMLGFTNMGIAGPGDVNGDGIDDIVVGGATTTTPGQARPVAYVIFGSRTPTDIDLADPAWNASNAKGVSITSDFWGGFTVGQAGDINADGTPDIVVGIVTDNVGSGSANRDGAVWVIYGSPSLSDVALNGFNQGLTAMGAWTAGNTKGMVIRGNRYAVSGVISGAQTGTVPRTTTGDVNGDGIDDLVFGDRQKPGVYVLYGSRSPVDIDLQVGLTSTQGFTITGRPQATGMPSPQAGTIADRIGSTVSGACDFNADGVNDILLGSQDSSQAYVIFGQRAATRANINFYTSPYPNEVINTNWSQGGSLGIALSGVRGTGSAVACADDVNSDGISDVIIAATGGYAANGTVSQVGALYVVYGSRTAADMDLTAMTADQGFTAMPTAGALSNEFQRMFTSAMRAGDVNGDGRSDVIMGRGRFSGPFPTAFVLYGFGPSALTYPNPITGLLGAAITPLAPTIERTGTASFSVVPDLPTGLTIDPATGVISGTPTGPVNGTYTVTMTDLNGTVTYPVQITILGTPQITILGTPQISIPSGAIVDTTGVMAVNAVSTGGTVVTRITRNGQMVCEVTVKPGAAGDITSACPLDDATRRAVELGSVSLLVTSTITDAVGQTATATRTLTSADVSPLPVALPVAESVPAGVATTIPLVQSVSGVGAVKINPASLALRDPATGAFGATVTIAGRGTFQADADGSVTFQPAAGYTGPVPPISYRFTDTAGRAATSTLAVTVRGAGSPPPWADPIAGLTTSGTPVTLNPFTGPGADSALFNLALTRIRAPRTGAWVSTFTLPGEGRYAVDARTGRVTFTPARGFTGWTRPVAYRVTAKTGQVVQSSLRVRVAPNAAALRTTVRVTKKVMPVGSRTTVRLRVQDTGRLDAANVVSRVKIPRGFRVVRTGGGILRGSEVIFRLGAIGVGKAKSRTIVLVASATASGTSPSVGAKSRATGVDWTPGAPAGLRVTATEPNPAVTG